ncbi:MAG: hypothetical protein AAB227_10960 [Pseudomonadota bacterium]
MSRLSRSPLTISAALAALSWGAAYAQDAAVAEPAAEAAPAEAPAINEDEMADLLNSQQQIKQDVTLTRSVNGQVVETKKETVVYSKDDPLRDSEAGLSPLEKLKEQFDSQALTRKEALEEAKLDFVVADLDRDDAVSADEFVYLVKGWESAEISGSGHGRFIDPYYHVDQEEADREHAEQARAKFAAMAGADLTMAKKAFTRKIVDEFEANDLDKDDLLRGDELLKFRAAVRGETVAGE